MDVFTRTIRGYPSLIEANVENAGSIYLSSFVFRIASSPLSVMQSTSTDIVESLDHSINFAVGHSDERGKQDALFRYTG